MIIVQLMGGLGNQMFQYAAGKRLSIKLNTELKVDISQLPKHRSSRPFMLGYFKLSTEPTGYGDNFRYWLPKMLPYRVRPLLSILTNLSEVKEKQLEFDPWVFTLTGNLYLRGYWQSPKYFQAIDSIIRKDFQFKQKPDKYNREVIKKMKSSNSIVIHIRRGDYVKDNVFNTFHGVCSLDYYKQSVKKIESRVKNPSFFIFSDDPKWAKKNITLTYPTNYITHNVGRKDWEDLRLMSYAKHHIIANSTFSWWGAYLANHPKQIVYAPKKWFNKAGLNTKDLIPKEWERV